LSFHILQYQNYPLKSLEVYRVEYCLLSWCKDNTKKTLHQPDLSADPCLAVLLIVRNILIEYLSTVFLNTHVFER
ncbi:MAG: hypothetical protein ACRCZQ_11210, partial [Bacteroidales bacterium]